MNPHAEHPYALIAIWRSVCRHRGLIWQMMRRGIVGRYRGSVLGIAWSFFQPLLMLAVYTFVFSVVFNATWLGDTGSGTAGFATVLFSGLIVHALFAECVNQSPTLVLHNANLVKRVVFPLEILPVVTIGVTLFHLMVSLVILFGAMLLSGLHLQITSLYLPVVLLPLVLATLGTAWMLAALGVYLRDIEHIVVVVTTVLLFLSPVFYPISAVPEQFRMAIYLNPISFIIEQVRTVVIWGGAPSWPGLLLYGGASLLVAWTGFCVFQYARKGFADVL